jgi:CheY-like chemotaxis protein
VTLIDRPVRLLSLVSVVRTALRARRRQYEARDMLERLRDGVQQRDHFLAMLGHELRNPLAAIVYAANLLSSRSEPRTIMMIARQARHLSRLVDELLDVSRVTSGKIVLKRAVVDLRDLIERSVESVRPGMKALTLCVDLDREPLLVNVDGMRMEQVVMNLLTNALKYTPSGGKVNVIARRDAGVVTVRIEDTGVGIPAEMLSRVFELFTQVDGSLDRAAGGLGVGLTIVRALVELHGGEVRAASNGPGTGARFEVRLPCAAAGAEPTTPRVTSPQPPCATGSRRVLVVEDDDDNREILRELLEAAGFCVEAEAEGCSAVARARAIAPEIALVDIGLPGMNGYEVARAIRRDLGERVYIAALSGYGQPEDRQKSRDAGFDTHLTKPVDIEVVTRLLREAPVR